MEQNRKGVKVHIVILLVVLTFLLTLACVFAFLYFGEKKANEDNVDETIVQTSVSTQAQTQTETQQQTEIKAQEETKVKVKNNGQKVENFDSYTISVYPPVDIYAGPGYNYSYVDSIYEEGVYTIVGEHTDSSGIKWGKLKSGVGWIDLQVATTSKSYGNYYGHYNDYSNHDFNDTPYTINLSLGETVYGGPGTSYEITYTIDKAGIYTIVEETYDSYGNKWGKLKSGVGWVLL